MRLSFVAQINPDSALASVSFFMADRPGAGGFFLGLVIIGTGVESKGVGRIIIIASGVLLIGITLYVASDEINP